MEEQVDDRDNLALEAALERANEAQDALEGIFTILAASIDLTGRIESAMEVSKSTRDAALVHLGRQVLQWYRSGGDIILESPETENEDAFESENLVVEEPVVEEPVLSEEIYAAETHTLEAEPVTEPIPQVPASLESIQTLTTGGLGVNWSASAPPISSLDRILDALSPPPSAAGFKAQLQRIQEINPHTWRGMPKNTQQDLTALLAAWGRHLQGLLDKTHSTVLSQFFGRLTEYSEREQPGFVYGLARQHRPRNGSWLEDALRVWRRLAPADSTPGITPETALTTLQARLHLPDIRPSVLIALQAGVNDDDPRLVQLLSSRLSALGDAPRLRKVRKAIRRHHNQSDRSQPLAVVAPWPHHAITSTWRVIILGGDRPKKLNPLLKDTFGFTDIRHESGKQIRRVLQLRESILAGKINLCLVVIRFLSHKASNMVVDACNEQGVTVVKMGSGLNLVPLREALSERLGGEE
ncbi:MAG: hypothetical protein ACI8RZ_004171 [Myxococcota bacterium]|jgi:hypothetical protein